MSLNDVDTFFSIIQRFLTIIGVFIGAIWAYYKYFRGRTFRPRMDTNILGNIVKDNGTLYLIATIKIKNVGLSRIDIKPKGSGMRIIGLIKKSGMSSLKRYKGKRIRTVSILNDHRWIEPGETIEDVQLFILPNRNYYGIKLDARLITKNIAWNFSSVFEVDKKKENKCEEGKYGNSYGAKTNRR